LVLELKVKGEHDIYCCGSRVRISEKGVEVLSEPSVEQCPLHDALYGTERIDVDTVRRSVEMKISGFGFCCRKRAFDAEPVVAYGASEMMRVWIEKKLVDCAIVVSEGAGTVITNNGKLVQAIGARLTGIIRTSPIPEIIDHIEANQGFILSRKDAKIDQLEGLKRAMQLGFKRVAISVAGFQAKTISLIRDFSEDTQLEAIVFSVCNTCVAEGDLEYVAKADIACASASMILRQKVGSKAVLQLGVTIPVYALTEEGRRLILAYLNESKDRLVVFRTSKMPYSIEGIGPKLRHTSGKQQRET